MLIIGHRGAAGLAPENTLAGLQAGIDAGADVLQFDVRLTRDLKPILLHDPTLLRTHGLKGSVANLTLADLQSLTASQPIPVLAEVLGVFYGKILLIIELRSRGSGEQVIELLKKHYIKKTSDWDKVLISSCIATELLRIRRLAPQANLALLHKKNPFAFIAYHRFVKFTAVGFHRLHINPLAIETAKRAGLFTYAYTVNRPAALDRLDAQGIDGVITNYPDKFSAN